MSKPTQAQRDRIRQMLSAWCKCICREAPDGTMCRVCGHAHRPMVSLRLEREVDGRWIAEVLAVPGALAYGKTRRQAIAAAMKIAHESKGEK